MQPDYDLGEIPFVDLRIFPGSDEFIEPAPLAARHAQNLIPPGAGQVGNSLYVWLYPFRANVCSCADLLDL